jgi:hypothetical protein
MDAWRGGLLALEAWARWRRVGEAVTIWRVRAVARWWPCPRGPSPCVAVRRRVLGAFLLAVPPVLVARGAAWRVAWRVQALGAAGLKRGAGLKIRVGRPAAGSATWRHVLVRLHTRFVRCALLTLTYTTLLTYTSTNWHKLDP